MEEGGLQGVWQPRQQWPLFPGWSHQDGKGDPCSGLWALNSLAKRPWASHFPSLVGLDGSQHWHLGSCLCRDGLCIRAGG